MDYTSRLAGDSGRGFELASPGRLHVLVVLLRPDRLGLRQLCQQNKVPTFAGCVEVRLRAVELVCFQERADEVADRVIIEGVKGVELRVGEGAGRCLWKACPQHGVVGRITALPVIT